MSTVWKSEAGRLEVRRFYEGILESWPGGFKRRDLDTPLGPTAVLESGRPEGPPLVLLHGSMSTSATWMGDVGTWGRKHRILAVDLPGEPGLSSARRPGLAGGEAADWLAAVLDGLGVPVAALVGMSLGGWYALRFATRYPSRVRALACVAPGGIAPRRADFLLRAIWCSLQGKKGAAKLERLVFHTVEVPEAVREFGALVRRHFIPLAEDLPLLGDEELSRLTMPFLYVGGDRDALLDTPASAARLRALLPRARVTVLEDRGHAILDQGGVIADFLD